jgi:hypothetical protein
VLDLAPNRCGGDVAINGDDGSREEAAGQFQRELVLIRSRR